MPIPHSDGSGPSKSFDSCGWGQPTVGSEAEREHCDASAACTALNNSANILAADCPGAIELCRLHTTRAACQLRLEHLPQSMRSSHAPPCAFHAMLLAGCPQQPPATSPGSEPAGCASHSTLEGILRPDDCAPSPAAARQSGCPNWAAAFRPGCCPAGQCTLPPAGPGVVRTGVMAVSRSNCRACKVLTHPSSFQPPQPEPRCFVFATTVGGSLARLEALPSGCRTRKAGFLSDSSNPEAAASSSSVCPTPAVGRRLQAGRQAGRQAGQSRQSRRIL